MIKSDVINDTFVQVDLTGDCYRLFLEFWKIAPGPSKIAPGSGKILWTRSNFYNKLAPGSRDLISRLDRGGSILLVAQLSRISPTGIFEYSPIRVIFPYLGTLH